MIQFEVTAPGKVILHGEHSVVYGKPAIAGVIGLKNRLNFQEMDTTEILIKCDKLELTKSFPVEHINDFYQTKIDNFVGIGSLPAGIPHDEFVEEIESFIKEIDTNLDVKPLNSLTSIFYLLFGIFAEEKIEEIPTGFEITITSEMSIGAGLGSSASFGVCVAATFKFYAECLNKNKNITVDNSVREYISRWAFCSERIMHGNPSGLDNTICTFGNIVKFYKGVKPIEIKLAAPLNILLVNTGVSRSTLKLVEKVAQLKEEHPKLMDHILSAMGQLVEDAVDVLKNFDGPTDTKSFTTLERLVSINNNLLRSIGVSHVSLEKIFAIAETNEFAGKLTGAGGGG